MTNNIIIEALESLNNELATVKHRNRAYLKEIDDLKEQNRILENKINAILSESRQLAPVSKPSLVSASTQAAFDPVSIAQEIKKHENSTPAPIINKEDIVAEIDTKDLLERINKRVQHVKDIKEGKFTYEHAERKDD